jgi:hypothetical protein
MRKLFFALALFAFAGCSSLQNPFTAGSSNYAFIQAICSSPMVAANPQYSLACATLGVVQPGVPTPAPVPAPAPAPVVPVVPAK